jgi:hypothetical protein
MRLISKIATLLFTGTLPVLAQAATLGGFYYATQYDFREFYWVTDGKPFQVILAGNPFPGLPRDEVARQLLPVMQANKPRPPLTFTYDSPVEPPHPYYRLYLIADPANDLLANGVCATGKVRHREATPGRVFLYAIYCRNDLGLSYMTAWTTASGPNDPAVAQLFKELFAAVFSDAAGTTPKGSGIMR